MSVFKDTFSRALSLMAGANVLKSDTINIPFPGNLIKSSQCTSLVNNKLIDSGGLFQTLGIMPGDTIWNTTSSSQATVVSVDSQIQLTISFNAFGTIGDRYSIYSTNNFSSGPTQGCYLYFSGAGVARVLTIGGDDVTINVSANSLLPLQVVRLFSSTTTATGVIAYF